MLRAKKILLTCLIVCLNGCQNIDTKIVIQCSNVNDHCFCRDYKLSKEFIGPESGFEEAPSDMCQGIVYPLDEYAEMNSWIQEARDKCVNRKKK